MTTVVTVTITCQGHVNGADCTAYRDSAVRLDGDDPGLAGEQLERAAAEISRGWGKLPDGSDLCPVYNHDEGVGRIHPGDDRRPPV